MSDETKFTPGPWAAHSPDTGSGHWTVWSTKGPHERDLPLVAATPVRIPAAEHEANARLIAAAPDLFTAAERALNYVENTEAETGVKLRTGDMLRAALSRARTAEVE